VMPRPRPPHLQREITRHGKPVWYVRVDRGARIRIKAEFARLRLTLNTAPHSLARQFVSRRHHATRWRGFSLDTVRPRHGGSFQRPHVASARISSRVF
jgi:hypothetical protein